MDNDDTYTDTNSLGADLQASEKEIRERAKTLFVNGQEHFQRQNYEEAERKLYDCVYGFQSINSYYFAPYNRNPICDTPPLIPEDQQFLDDATNLLNVVKNCCAQISINKGLEKVKRDLNNYKAKDALNRLLIMRADCSSITNIQDVANLNYIPLVQLDTSISILKTYLKELEERQKKSSRALSLAIVQQIISTRHIGSRDYAWLVENLQQLFINHWNQLDQCDLKYLKQQIVDCVLKKLSKRPFLQFLLGEEYIPDYRRLRDGIESTINDNPPYRDAPAVWLPILRTQNQQPVMAIVVDNYTNKDTQVKTALEFVFN